jgi:hypothetical protein
VSGFRIFVSRYNDPMGQGLARMQLAATRCGTANPFENSCQLPCVTWAHGLRRIGWPFSGSAGPPASTARRTQTSLGCFVPARNTTTSLVLLVSPWLCCWPAALAPPNPGCRTLPDCQWLPACRIRALLVGLKPQSASLCLASSSTPSSSGLGSGLGLGLRHRVLRNPPATLFAGVRGKLLYWPALQTIATCRSCNTTQARTGTSQHILTLYSISTTVRSRHNSVASARCGRISAFSRPLWRPVQQLSTLRNAWRVTGWVPV